ncbi:SDR family NAD(P)-dependent oxidoreductase [Halopseudomonas bauzanensis]|uniref:SDR family NAD(P)-dependent oxidoreductase n=1 Tax=Halopseudomonas bauzanensis TaxID=653930 RepID=UPI00255446E7|nr:SDR family oxidoreductase [Halopseudomonas bauzanensis]
MSHLQGKRALIIGAAGRDNMGQVIARRLARDGARVFVSGRNEDELARLSEELQGGYATCDITQRQDVERLANACVEQLGGIDIAVNATGWGLLKPFELTSDEELERMCQLQFTGPFKFFQAVLPHMGEGGSLVQISSATATIMLENHAAYMGTKAGFDHVIRCLANEYGHRGIRANSISPGFTETPMTAAAAAIPGIKEVYQACYPLGRLGTAEDIAAAVSWVSCDECFMTGQNLQINGGLTLRRNPMLAEVDAAAIKATGKPRPRPWKSNK